MFKSSNYYKYLTVTNIEKIHFNSDKTAIVNDYLKKIVLKVIENHI